MTTRVLVIDDEPQMGRLLRTTLGAHGYAVDVVTYGLAALNAAATLQPDLLLLDLGLPGIDGLEVCRRVREWSQVPIIVLTVHDSEQEKVAALDAGADDYLTKPFGMNELLARMRVALRHAVQRGAAAPQVIAGTALQIDLVHRRVTANDREVHLTPTEYALLHLLATNSGKVLTHRMLLREVWGSASVQDTPTLRVFITQLRHKIEPDPANPRIILTEPGVGYRLQLDE